MNAIIVFATPKGPKRPIIYVIVASPSPKRVISINSVRFKSDSPNLFTRYKQSKVSSYKMVAHTYNTCRNKQNVSQSNTYLPPSQPNLPQAHKPSVKQPSDYDLIEQLHVTLVEILLWDLLMIALIYQGML